MKLKRLPIVIVAFVIAYGIGFGAALLIKDYLQGQDSVPAGEPFPVQETVSERQPVVTEPPVQPDTLNVVVKDSPVIAGVDGPSFIVRDRYYMVTVDLDPSMEDKAGLEFNLYDDGGTLVKTEKTPRFSVPQSESGVYYISVTDTETGMTSDKYEIKGCVVRRMSKARLEQICNSGDYTTMRNVEAYELSPDITFAFTGDGEDKKAVSIDDICTRISLGIWSSVSILDIAYDEMNLVKYVKFQVKK